LRRARSDLALAKAPLPTDVLYADLCFHAQQAAEKAIKAVYRASRYGFRYTHDLSELLDGLALHGVLVPQEIREAATLTDFAGEARYPGPAELVTEDEYRRAVTLAEKVLEWAAQLVKG